MWAQNGNKYPWHQIAYDKMYIKKRKLSPSFYKK